MSKRDGKGKKRGQWPLFMSGPLATSREVTDDRLTLDFLICCTSFTSPLRPLFSISLMASVYNL